MQKTARSSTQLSTTGRCGRRRASSSDIGEGEWPDEDSAQELRIDRFMRVQAAFLTGSARTLYAHPEFAYPIVNLMRVRSPIAKNQAAPRRRFQVA
jgi:hypothetical protein